MNIVTFPLDVTDYTADALGAWFAARTRGVFAADGHYHITTNGNMTVTVGTGLAWLRMTEHWGVVAFNQNPVVLEVPQAENATHRVDAVCLQLDKAANLSRLILKKGTPGAIAPPPPVRNASLDEIYLATIYVPAGVVSIQPIHITDQRLNEAYCGIMSDGTKIPTQQLYDGWMAWFRELRTNLDEDAAGSLYNLIAAHKADEARHVSTVEREKWSLGQWGTFLRDNGDIDILKAMYAGAEMVHTFTSDSSFVPIPGRTYGIILTGAGGAGASATRFGPHLASWVGTHGGAGGGSGVVNIATWTAPDATVVPITVGRAGAGNGGTSSFGNIVSAEGGTAGAEAGLPQWASVPGRGGNNGGPGGAGGETGSAGGAGSPGGDGGGARGGIAGRNSSHNAGAGGGAGGLPFGPSAENTSSASGGGGYGAGGAGGRGSGSGPNSTLEVGAPGAPGVVIVILYAETVSPSLLVLTSSDVFIPIPGHAYKIILIGGGGAGAAATNGESAGGGSGVINVATWTAPDNTTIPVTIGTAGTGNGGTSSFGNIVSAEGGTVGQGGSGSNRFLAVPGRGGNNGGNFPIAQTGSSIWVTVPGVKAGGTNAGSSRGTGGFGTRPVITGAGAGGLDIGPGAGSTASASGGGGYGAGGAGGGGNSGNTLGYTGESGEGSQGVVIIMS